METLTLSIIIVTVIAGTVLYLRRENRRFTAPKATLTLAAVTLVTSTIGNLNPEILALFGRNREQLLRGEWWRIVTPLFMQDGGWLGMVTNLIALIMIGLCVETFYRRGPFLTVYFLAGVVSEIFAYTLFQHQGFAGNSVANNGIAALCLVTLCTVKVVPARILGAIGAVTGVVQLALGNLHGVGFTVGALAAVAIVWRKIGLRATPITADIKTPRLILHPVDIAEARIILDGKPTFHAGGPRTTPSGVTSTPLDSE